MRNAILPLALAAALSGAGCTQVHADSRVAGMAAPLSDAEVAAIQQLCATASFQYARALDGKNPEALARAFAPDGVWEVLGNRMAGREAIRQYLAGRLTDWAPTHGRIHQIANQVIEVIDRDHARGTSNAIVYFFDTADGANAELKPSLIAQNTDEFVRTAEGWKISRRTVSRIANVGAH